MDLSYFISNYGGGTVGEDIGLYCCRQNLPSHKDVYRIGAAGIKEVDATYGSRRSSFKSRFAMYLANWITTDGVVHCIMTQPQSRYQGFSHKYVQPPGDRDGLPNYARPGSTILQARERELHAELEKRGVRRFHTARSEWFQGPLERIKEAFQRVGGGKFFDFSRGNTPPENQSGLEIGRHNEVYYEIVQHKRSPRFQDARVRLNAQGQAEVQNKTPRGEYILERILEDMDKVGLRRSERLKKNK